MFHVKHPPAPEWLGDLGMGSGSTPYQAYLEESHSPIVSLIFTLPLFLAYHLGIWAIQKLENAPWANGADRLLAVLLTKFGVSGPLLSLCFVVTVLLIWQQASGRPWRVRGITLLIMFLESCFFSLPPFLLGKVVRHALMSAGADAGLPVPPDRPYSCLCQNRASGKHKKRTVCGARRRCSDN